MPITLRWAERKRILEYTISGEVTIGDIRRVMREELGYYESAGGTVHVLVDVTTLDRLPENFLSAVRRSALFSPQRGHAAIVGATPTVRMYVDLLSRYTGRRDHSYYQTREEALAALARQGNGARM